MHHPSPFNRLCQIPTATILVLRSRHRVIGFGQMCVYDRIMQRGPFRYGIDPTLSERISPQSPPRCQGDTPDRAVGADGVFGVVAATRVEATLPPEDTRQRRSVEADRYNEERARGCSGVPREIAERRHRSLPFLPLRSSAISLTRSWVLAAAIDALATSTASEPRVR